MPNKRLQQRAKETRPKPTKTCQRNTATCRKSDDRQGWYRAISELFWAPSQSQNSRSSRSTEEMVKIKINGREWNTRRHPETPGDTRRHPEIPTNTRILVFSVTWPPSLARYLRPGSRDHARLLLLSSFGVQLYCPRYSLFGRCRFGKVGCDNRRGACLPKNKRSRFATSPSTEPTQLPPARRPR